MLKFRYQVKGATDQRIKKRLKEIGVLKKSEAKSLGVAVEKEMKKLIAKGLSPVRGNGLDKEFPPYKDPDKYPGKRKAKSPVNLKLTGHQLKNLKNIAVKIGKSWTASVGYDNAFAKKKEDGHSTGGIKGVNDQPRRPTIPRIQNGESFATPILNAILKKLRQILRERRSSN